MRSPINYSLVTPVRDESANLPRLAASVIGQTKLPSEWLIVDNGSRDSSRTIAAQLANSFEWIHALNIPAASGPIQRGLPSVRAFTRGLEMLRSHPDIIVQLDADVSFGRDYFERLVDAFVSDQSLGIASGSALEKGASGSWRRRHVTGASVWGASRAYRRDCLMDVMPLEERVGWDGIDEMKARARGWSTRTLVDVLFFHHRPEGARDGNRRAAWAARGRAAHFMGYRWWYLALRAMHHALRDPAALSMILSFSAAHARRRPRCSDPTVCRLVREDQKVSALPSRFREAMGRAATTADRPS